MLEDSSLVPEDSTMGQDAAQESLPQEPQESAPVEAVEKPKRRRSASRAAGAPKQVEVVAEVPQTRAAGNASVVVPDENDQPAEKPKRRRATRQAGAAAPVQPAAEVPQTRPAFEVAPEEATAAPVFEEQSSPQASALDEPGSDESVQDEEAPAEEPQPDSEPVEDEPAEAPAPTEKPARARRSRSRRTKDEPGEAVAEAPELPAAPQEPASQQEQQAQGTDQLDAALAAATEAAAKRPRRARKVAGTLANPFMTPTTPVGEDGEVDAKAVLDSLAASIARGDSPESEALAADPEDLDEAIEDDEQEQAVADQAHNGPEQDEHEQDDQDEDSDENDSDDSEGSDESDDSGEVGSRRRRRRRGGRRRRRSSDQDSETNDQADDGQEDRDDSEDESSDDEDGQDDSGQSSSSGSRRRRRSRSGRHRSSSDDDDQNGSDQGSDDSDDHDDSDDSDQSGDGTRRRRRRRRRRGEDAGGTDDDPSDVVVRVREPRRIRTAAQAADEVTGIDGSTRMEAKKQRRREGRAAGRRRVPILSEAEFLARRESVNRRMVIRQGEDYTQLAVLEDDILVEHYVDRASATSLIGNVYLGRVQNVLPSMEAAFIDIGRGRNAVLYAGEVDWAQFGAAGEHKKVEQVLKSGQTILVQVSKDPVGAKGARLTGHISLPGRYVVYSPGGHLSGISRKLADSERHRLKEILGDVVDDNSSVIVRTAAEGASEEELLRDVNRLKAQWEIIEKKAKQGSAPQQLYAEPDLTVRIVRDLFTEDFSELVVAGNGGPEDAYETINGYVTHVAPHLAGRLTKWETEAQGDPFAKYKIDEQIAKALERKVFLPSGGSLVIDRTEAMTVIDVNTGKFTGSGGNLEATVTSNNLEAAEEVVRQLRLRDIGGIIVVDFIDMVLPSNRELLLRRLVECLGRDRTRHQVAEVTSLGLVQMTRKKIGTGLAEAFTEECEGCGGRGYVRHDHPVESQSPADGGERNHGGRRGRRGH
ncbi:Rne/Rng family ribonuclease [Luteococcus sp.]|uniref:Rne/Rng family ribonuclease n=1 Tax=Luteococcus sp. TaxID=1969402 RepID=UPI003735FE76